MAGNVRDAYDDYLARQRDAGVPDWASKTFNEFARRWDGQGGRPAIPDGNYGQPAGGDAGGWGGVGGGGGSAGPTDQQRQAAANLGQIAGWNAGSTTNQYEQQMGNFDVSDKQNRALADVQVQQSQRSAAADRFGMNKKLQTATHGVLGSAGNAMQGSSLFELINMLQTRTDLDSNEVWQALTKNKNAIENAYTEAFNANRLARNEAGINAEFALRGIESDTAAQLNNIHPDLFVAPGGEGTSFGSEGFYDKRKLDANIAALAGYIMPDNAMQGAQAQQAPNTMQGASYFDQLLNQYNQRSR